MNERILVVEDDAPTRRSFFYLLGYEGYEVHEAANGEKALELLASEQFAVVITDIIMGEVDGLVVLRVARQQPYQPEVIMLTGHGSFETAVLALREGAFDYLSKPCDGDLLRTTVDRALQRYQANQQVRAAAQTLMTALYGKKSASQPQQEEHDSRPLTEELDETLDPTLALGALVLGPTRRDVTFADQEVYLTHTEYLLLRYLANHVGQLCPSVDIVRVTHELTVDEVEAQTLLKPHIHNLRKKLDSTYILTERGMGYRFVIPGEGENLAVG